MFDVILSVIIFMVCGYNIGNWFKEFTAMIKEERKKK